MNHIPRATRRRIEWAPAIAALTILAASTAQAQRPLPNRTAPAATSTSAASSQLSTVQAHAIFGANAKGVAAKLKEIYAGQAGLAITDTANGQTVVQGSPAGQQEIP